MKKIMKNIIFRILLLYTTVFTATHGQDDKMNKGINAVDTNTTETLLHLKGIAPITTENISNNFYAQIIMTTASRQQTERKSEDLIKPDSFDELFRRFNYDQRNQFIQNLQEIIIFNHEFNKIKDEISTNMILNYMLLKQPNTEIKKRLILQDIIEKNEKEISSDRDQRITDFTQKYHENHENHYMPEYQVYEFNNEEEYDNKADFDSYNSNIYNLSNFIISPYAQYMDEDDKRIFNNKFLSMIKNKLEIATVEYNSKFYVLNLKLNKEQVKIDSNVLRKIKAREYEIEIYTQLQNKFLEEKKQQYLSIDKEKKAFTLNKTKVEFLNQTNASKVEKESIDQANLKNLLKFPVIYLYLTQVYRQEAKILDPQTEVSDSQLLKFITSMTYKDFVDFISKEEIISILIFNEYFEENQEYLTSKYAFTWYSEMQNISTNTLFYYLIYKNQNALKDAATKSTNEKIEELYMKPDSPERNYYKLRYYRFNDYISADDFMHSTQNTKTPAPVDISETSLLSPLINYTAIYQSNPNQDKLLYLIEQCIEDRGINYDKKKLPSRILIDEEVNKSYYVIEIYDVAKLDLTRFEKKLLEHNSALKQIEFMKQLRIDIIKKYEINKSEAKCIKLKTKSSK